MIKNYLTMKKNEWKIKGMLYGAIAILFDNQKNIWELIQKMYIALKDVPVENIQQELVTKLAEIIHNENKDKTE